jgi:hypothetical protein
MSMGKSMGGTLAKRDYPVISIQKSRARLASPQPRPTSPVDGAGGMTGCHDDASPAESFLGVQKNLHTVK